MNTLEWLGQHNPYLVDAGNGHYLHPSVLPAFKKMQLAAIKQGIDLQIVSSYRNFDRQCAIWNKKWRGDTVLLDVNGRPLNFSKLTNNDKLHAILTWSALPGGSRHHWGTDFDVYDKTAVSRWQQPFSLVDSEYQPNGPCHALAIWLQEHMQDFGFYRPFERNNGGVARELWHVSHQHIAAEFEQSRQLSQLIKAIEQSSIEGKPVILDNIEEIYHRYILNLGDTWR